MCYNIFLKKRGNNAASLELASMYNLIDKEKYSDIKYGIKLGYKNIGFNGKFYTFPYFLAIFIKRFLREKI